MSKFEVGDLVVLNTKSVYKNTRFTIVAIANKLSDPDHHWCTIKNEPSQFGRWEEDLYWFPKEYLNKDRENK